MPLPSPSDILSKVQGGSTQPLFSAPTASTPSPQQVLDQSRGGASGSFIGNLAKTAVSFVKKAVPAIGGFIGAQASNVADATTGNLPVTPADVLDGIKKTGSGIQALAIGFNEGVARIAKSASIATLGESATKKISDSPIGDFARVATGRKNFIESPGVAPAPEAGVPLSSYQDIYGRAKNYALENDASIDQAGTFGALTVLGALFVDNPLMGPGKGSAIKLSEQAVKDMAKESGEDAIKAILKAENPALRDIELEALAPVFREAKTEQEVKTALEQVSKIQRAPLAKTADELPPPEEIFARSQQNLETPKIPTAEIPEPRPSFFRSIKSEDNAVKFVPVDGQPVKIADGLDTFIHQPENGAFEVLESSTGRLIGRVAETPEAALKSAQEAVRGKKLEEILAAVQEAQKAAPGPRETLGMTQGTPAAARAAERGLQPTAAPRPFDTNLIRDISKEDMPGPILERLQSQFSNLSSQALTPIAKRLSSLKRTGDIEGILQVVRNISEDISRSRAAGPVKISKETLDRSIAKVGTKEAVGDLPPSIGELLTATERGRYIDNISRVVRNREDAVLAQQEYETLWEYADQRVVDRYEELKVQRDILRDMIENGQGKQLNALYRGTFISPDDVGLDQLIASKPNRRLDSRIGEIMAGQDQPGVADTVAQGQKALDEWKQMRKDLAGIEANMRELRPRVRAVRVLQSMVEDVPVIARKEAGEIEAIADAEAVRKVYKDISGFMGQARDLYRNFEHVFGERFDEVKRVILDPFDRSKGAMVDELTAIGDDLEKNVIKKLGIEKGSRLSAAVQRYGDSSLHGGEQWSFDRLVAEVGSADASKVVEADAYFRSRYNTLIERVNAVRREIYPNDPQKLIPQRKDYYRHFQELGDGYKSLIDLFESPAGINPQLAGLSEWTKPKSKFLSFAQQRLGKETTIDAVGGFLNYAPSFAYAVHIDPHIGKFRYLRRRLAEVSPTPGVRELVDAANPEAAAMGAKDLVPQEGINNFLSYLDDFANDLAGKTNPMDRFIQKVLPGGRKTFRVIDWINARVKANTILGNLSSAVAQIFNVPNGVASAKLYSVPGMQRTVSSLFVKNEPIEASAFIKERFQQDIASRFKMDWVEHPVRGSSERAKEVAIWITQVMDEVGTKFVWNSHYEKALAEGASDPIKYADDITRKLVAGRGIGEVPLVQKSKIFQLVAPFQIEVGNAWYILGGFISRKDFAAVATLFIANYLMNRAAEQVRGTPVVFDPIQSLIDGATQAADEMEEGNSGRAAFKFAGRQAGEILSNIPFGQSVAAALPDAFVEDKLGFQGGKKELFGSADPGRFGGGLLAINGVMDPMYRLFPPFGGMQAKRTIGGIQSMLEGRVSDAGDRLSFETSATFKNIAQAVLFGKNATDEARSFYDTRDDLFQRIYRQDAQRTEKGVEAQSVWAEVKKLPREQAVKRLQELEKSDPAMADAVAAAAEDEAKGLTGTERLIKMLGVENGERAKYISDTVSGLASREEQVAYLKNLDEKDLISDTVFDQLMLLLKGKMKEQ